MKSRALITLFLAAGCNGEGPSEPVAEPQRLHLVAVTETSVVGTVATVLETDPVVAVVDQYGKPVSGILVTFRLNDGGLGGTISFGMNVTDKYGRASAGNWTLNRYPSMQTVTASIHESSTTVSFTALGVVDAPAKIISSSALIGGAALSQDTIVISAQITDRLGNWVPVAGIPLSFTASIAGIPLPPVERMSDEKGQALFLWILGSEPVRNSIAITSPGLSAFSHDLQVLDRSRASLFDLVEIGGDPPSERLIQSGSLALSDDGHFISTMTGAPYTELEGVTRASGKFERDGDRITLKFSDDYWEHATQSGDEVLVDRWDPVGPGCCIKWRFARRK